MLFLYSLLSAQVEKKNREKQKEKTKKQKRSKV
jgi:hypothetical protein